jgi:hypothetical protein
MGLRLWLIAASSDAAAIWEATDHPHRWPILEIEGLGYEDVCQLWAVLSGRKGKELEEALGETLEDGNVLGSPRHVSEVGREFIGALAHLGPDEVPAIAARWSARLSDKDVEPMGGRTAIQGWVERLAQFAAQAKARGLPVLELLDCT